MLVTGCVSMPRAKATDVVIHRIELGGKEREMAEGVIAAYQFNKVANPVVAGMSDVSFMLTLGAILTLFYPDIVLPKADEGIDAVTNAIKVGINAGRERAEFERELTGEATLDDATGPTDLIGRVIYNLTNPNWSWFR